MNYQGVVWQEIFLRMSLHQRRAAAFVTEPGEAAVAGLENYILNSARKEKSVRTDGAVVPIEDTADLEL